MEKLVKLFEHVSRHKEPEKIHRTPSGRTSRKGRALKDYLSHFVQVSDHKFLVLLYTGKFCTKLMYRALAHDFSKLFPDEARGFSKSSRTFRKIPYGGTTYNRYLSHLGESLVFHYRRNKHHPQHYSDGVRGMDLLDLVEMFYDWAAASKRQSRGSLRSSIDKNTERFSISEDLSRLLMNERNRFRDKN